VKVGQRVEGVTTPGGQRFQARVWVKNAVVDPAARTVEVLADLVRVRAPGPARRSRWTSAPSGRRLFLPATALRSGPEDLVLLAVGGRARAPRRGGGPGEPRHRRHPLGALRLRRGGARPRHPGTRKAVAALADEAAPRQERP
jgi:hypothetical protein